MDKDERKVKDKISYFLFIIAVVLCTFRANAQEYNGTTGLLHVPSAETDSAGTFRGGISYLDKRFTTAKFGNNYNTFSYTIGITAFKWLEFSYNAVLLKYVIASKSPKAKFYNEDRHVSVKVTPLYEGKWWPAIALGWDDINYRLFKETDELGANNCSFLNLYIVGSKHFDIKGYEIGAHLAYRYYPSDKNIDRRGVAGGITFRPAFYPPLRLIAEWDGVGINAGADVLLWRHLFIQAALIHGRGFTGGIGYHYTIPF